MRPTLFVLLPSAEALAELLGGPPPAALTVRTYPPADDARHLLSLVRQGRDPVATRWLPGLLLAIALGAGLGGATMAVLAGSFGLLGGLVGLAAPFGLLLGAFLGGFTAAMAGTESACDEVRALARHVPRGARLASLTSDDTGRLRELADRCTAAGAPWQRRG